MVRDLIFPTTFFACLAGGAAGGCPGGDTVELLRFAGC